MTWLVSWLAGRWLPLVGLLAVLGLLAGLYGLGRSHGSAATQARWDAAIVKAAQDARKVEGRWEARVEAAVRETSDAQAKADSLGAAVDVLAGQLRQYAARPRPMPAASTDPVCARELAAERERTRDREGLLAEGAGHLGRIALERDRLAAQVAGLLDAWPR